MHNPRIMYCSVACATHNVAHNKSGPRITLRIMLRVVKHKARIIHTYCVRAEFHFPIIRVQYFGHLPPCSLLSLTMQGEPKEAVPCALLVHECCIIICVRPQQLFYPRRIAARHRRLLCFRLSCGRKVLEKGRIRELILAWVSKVV